MIIKVGKTGSPEELKHQCGRRNNIGNFRKERIWKISSNKHAPWNERLQAR